MPEDKTLIVDAAKVEQKITRIAYQIYENNYNEKELILAGIQRQGYYFAQKLSTVLNNISPLKVTLSSLSLNKKAPHAHPVELDMPAAELDNKVIVVVDDVVNTGKTLTYALKAFLDVAPKKLQVAVLIDRKHKTYPVGADYVGLLLSTTMKEHVSVEIDKAKKEAVYLTEKF